MGDWPARPSLADRKRLDAAMNEILGWATEELADGWEIRLTMRGGDNCGEGETCGDGEVQLDLIDPDDKVVSNEWDGDSLTIWDMVDHSRNPNVDAEPEESDP